MKYGKCIKVLSLIYVFGLIPSQLRAFGVEETGFEESLKKLQEAKEQVPQLKEREIPSVIQKLSEEEVQIGRKAHLYADNLTSRAADEIKKINKKITSLEDAQKKLKASKKYIDEEGYNILEAKPAHDQENKINNTIAALRRQKQDFSDIQNAGRELSLIANSYIYLRIHPVKKELILLYYKLLILLDRIKKLASKIKMPEFRSAVNAASELRDDVEKELTPAEKKMLEETEAAFAPEPLEPLSKEKAPLAEPAAWEFEGQKLPATTNEPQSSIVRSEELLDVGESPNLQGTIRHHVMPSLPGPTE